MLPVHLRKAFVEKPVTRPFLELHALKGLRWMRAGSARGAVDLGTPPKPVQVDGDKTLTYMRDVFAKIGKYSRAKKTPVLVAMLLTTPAGPGKLEPIGGAAREAGLAFADLSHGFEGKDPTRFRIYRVDNHPNEAGHRLFADQLMPALQPFLR
jgi:hypothetical protein